MGGEWVIGGWMVGGWGQMCEQPEVGCRYFPIGLFRVAMSPRSASHRPRHT